MHEIVIQTELRVKLELDFAVVDMAIKEKIVKLQKKRLEKQVK